MKKILLTFILSSLVFAGFSQQRTLLRRQFGTWSVTGNLGTTYAKTDLTDKKMEFNTLVFKPDVGIKVSKQLSHFFSLEMNYNNGSCAAKTETYEFTTSIDQIDARMRFNLTNGQILANNANTQIYGYLGAGLVYYSVNKDSLKSNNEWVHVIPVGIGVKQRMSSRTSLNIDLSYNALNTDNFDGRPVTSSNQDGYTRVSIGVQYTLGKKPVLEWDKYTQYFTPLDEHSVDTVFVINRNVDTLFVRFLPDDSAMFAAKNILVANGGETLKFDFNKWNIKNKYFESLDDLATKINKGDIKNIVLDGHSCDVGTDKNNYYISKQRAISVKNYLISKGVDENKIEVRFHGEEQPISDEKSENRRVEIQYK